MVALNNRNDALSRHVQELLGCGGRVTTRQEQMEVLEKRYGVCRQEREDLSATLEESKKYEGVVMSMIDEMVQMKCCM